MIEIAAARESENPEDCGVKLRGIQTTFFNGCLPVASQFVVTDSIDSWISVFGFQFWPKRRAHAQTPCVCREARTVVLRSFAPGEICVIENPRTLSGFGHLGCGGCSRGPGLLGSPGLAFPPLTFPWHRW